MNLRRSLKHLALLWLCLLSTSLHAMTLEQPLADPALEARAQTLFQQLRCITCESQSLYDSRAPLAEDMRHMIRDKLQRGISEDTIITELRQHYGDVILLTPPIDTHPLLWLMPLAIIVIGCTGFSYHRRRKEN